MTDESKVRLLNGVTVPEGETIVLKDGRPVTPANPIIPFIQGDGIGPEISAATIKVVDAAAKACYAGQRRIAWMEIFAGEVALSRFGKALPADTETALREFKVAMKGPLNTPTGGGMRSVNVQMRKVLDLYRCVRPFRHFAGVPSVMVAPEKMNVVVFRENTEDVYAGIEYQAESTEAQKLVTLLKEFGETIRDDAAVGIKIMTRHCSRRLVRAAIRHALENGLRTVTMVHKGNIQKYTEGAFRAWGYELAAEEFADKVVTESELKEKFNWKLPEGKILLNDRIADAMFVELLLRPERYSVIATTNLNGDYLSDACAAQVGGLGMAPGANIGDECAIFEATHGTAPDIAGKGIANPSSLILSAVMMLEHIGWNEAAAAIVTALEKTIAAKTVTGDLARFTSGARQLSTDEFADALIANMPVVRTETTNQAEESKADQKETVDSRGQASARDPEPAV